MVKVQELMLLYKILPRNSSVAEARERIDERLPRVHPRIGQNEGIPPLFADVPYPLDHQFRELLEELDARVAGCFIYIEIFISSRLDEAFQREFTHFSHESYWEPAPEDGSVFKLSIEEAWPIWEEIKDFCRKHEVELDANGAEEFFSEVC